MFKAQLYRDMYLWNLNMDRLIRVLQRLEQHSQDHQSNLAAMQGYETRVKTNNKGAWSRWDLWPRAVSGALVPKWTLPSPRSAWRSTSFPRPRTPQR